jgi:hypothetical protein
MGRAVTVKVHRYLGALYQEGQGDWIADRRLEQASIFSSGRVQRIY